MPPITRSQARSHLMGRGGGTAVLENGAVNQQNGAAKSSHDNNNAKHATTAHNNKSKNALMAANGSHDASFGGNGGTGHLATLLSSLSLSPSSTIDEVYGVGILRGVGGVVGGGYALGGVVHCLCGQTLLSPSHVMLVCSVCRCWIHPVCCGLPMSDRSIIVAVQRSDAFICPWCTAEALTTALPALIQHERDTAQLTRQLGMLSTDHLFHLHHQDHHQQGGGQQRRSTHTSNTSANKRLPGGGASSTAGSQSDEWDEEKVLEVVMDIVRTENKKIAERRRKIFALGGPAVPSGSMSSSTAVNHNATSGSSSVAVSQVAGKDDGIDQMGVVSKVEEAHLYRMIHRVCAAVKARGYEIIELVPPPPSALPHPPPLLSLSGSISSTPAPVEPPPAMLTKRNFDNAAAIVRNSNPISCVDDFFIHHDLEQSPSASGGGGSSIKRKSGKKTAAASVTAPLTTATTNVVPLVDSVRDLCLQCCQGAIDDMTLSHTYPQYCLDELQNPPHIYLQAAAIIPSPSSSHSSSSVSSAHTTPQTTAVADRSSRPSALLSSSFLHEAGGKSVGDIAAFCLSSGRDAHGALLGMLQTLREADACHHAIVAQRERHAAMLARMRTALDRSSSPRGSTTVPSAHHNESSSSTKKAQKKGSLRATLPSTSAPGEGESGSVLASSSSLLLHLPSLTPEMRALVHSPTTEGEASISDFVHFSLLSTREEHRGRGLGKLLMCYEMLRWGLRGRSRAFVSMALQKVVVGEPLLSPTPVLQPLPLHHQPQQQQRSHQQQQQKQAPKPSSTSSTAVMGGGGGAGVSGGGGGGFGRIRCRIPKPAFGLYTALGFVECWPQYDAAGNLVWNKGEEDDGRLMVNLDFPAAVSRIVARISDNVPAPLHNERVAARADNDLELDDKKQTKPRYKSGSNNNKQSKENNNESQQAEAKQSKQSTKVTTTARKSNANSSKRSRSPL